MLAGLEIKGRALLVSANSPARVTRGEPLVMGVKSPLTVIYFAILIRR